MADFSHLQPGLNDLCQGKDITMETTATHYSVTCAERGEITSCEVLVSFEESIIMIRHRDQAFNYACILQKLIT